MTRCAVCRHGWAACTMTVATREQTSEAVPRCTHHTREFMDAVRGVPGLVVTVNDLPREVPA